MPNEVVATLKGDGSASWLVVHGETVDETQALLDDALKGPLFQTVAEASTLLAGATKVANGLPAQGAPQQSAPVQDQRQQVQQNPQQNQWQQQNSPPANGSGFNGTPHPQGKVCQMCGAGIVGKQPREKRMWTCPNQRSKGDGHYVEWING